MKDLDVKNFNDLKDVFKLMVGEMLENGLDVELDDFDRNGTVNILKLQSWQVNQANSSTYYIIPILFCI